jgi:hypothetical protein
MRGTGRGGRRRKQVLDKQKERVKIYEFERGSTI